MPFFELKPVSYNGISYNRYQYNNALYVKFTWNLAAITAYVEYSNLATKGADLVLLKLLPKNVEWYVAVVDLLKFKENWPKSLPLRLH